MLTRRALLHAGLFAAAASPLHAQSRWPDKPLKMVVPFAPGGATDIAGRVTADAIAQVIGKPVIVENRAGGGGNLGVEAAASAAPDGYTLMMGTQALITQNPFPYDNLRKDPQKDLVPVVNAFKTDMIMVVSPKLQAKTLQEVIALAKARPDAMNYGSAGNGSAAHILMELFKVRSGAKITHIPYRGTGPALTDLVGGTLDLMIDSMASSIGQIKGGNVRPIAVCGPTRNPRLPDVPTFMESGLSDYSAVAWLAVFAPKGTPQDIIDRVDTAVKTSLAKPEVADRGVQAGLDVDYLSSADLQKRIVADTAIWSEVIRNAQIKVN